MSAPTTTVTSSATATPKKKNYFTTYLTVFILLGIYLLSQYLLDKATAPDSSSEKTAPSSYTNAPAPRVLYATFENPKMVVTTTEFPEEYQVYIEGHNENPNWHFAREYASAGQSKIGIDIVLARRQDLKDPSKWVTLYATRESHVYSISTGDYVYVKHLNTRDGVPITVQDSIIVPFYYRNSQ